MILGVDPGVTGAFATLSLRSVRSTGTVARVHAQVFEVPTITLSGTKKAMNGREVLRTLHCLFAFAPIVGLEDVHAMPKQGVSSTFKFGRNLGQWEGILWSLNTTIHYIRPQDWKKEFGLLRKDKDAARQVAMDLFPEVHLPLKKDTGKADALLIAEYTRRKHGSD